MPLQPSNADVLEPVSNEGYGNWPLPCARDQEIAAVVDAMAAGSQLPIAPRHSLVLIAFAERMASLARTEGSLDRLRAGLVAIVIAMSVGDVRDGITVLPLLWRTAEVLGISPEREFRSAAERVGGGDAVIEFTRRDPQERSLDEMGYVEESDEFGFHYQRTW